MSDGVAFTRGPHTSLTSFCEGWVCWGVEEEDESKVWHGDEDAAQELHIGKRGRFPSAAQRDPR